MFTLIELEMEGTFEGTPRSAENNKISKIQQTLKFRSFERRIFKTWRKPLFYWSPFYIKCGLVFLTLTLLLVITNRFRMS